MELATLAPPLRKVAGWSAFGGTVQPPLFDEGRVYLASRGRALGAYDAATAAPIWEIDVQPTCGACVLDGDHVLARASESELWVVEAASGRVIDRHTTPALLVGLGFVAGDRLVAPIRDGQAHLGAYDLSSRSFAWQRPMARQLDSLPAGDRGVLVQAEASGFTALRLADGEPLWHFDVTGPGRYTSLGESLAGTPANHPIIAGGCVLGGFTGHHLVSLDLATGAMYWLRRVEDVVPCHLALAYDGPLYLLGITTLCAFDPMSGEPLAQLEITPRHAPHGDGPFAGLAVTEAFVFTVDRRGVLLAIARDSGQVAWSAALDASVVDAPIVADERLFVRDVEGTLHVFTAA